MTDCEHQNIHIGWQVHHYAATSIHTAHFNATCADCGVRFRFCGDMALQPPDLDAVMASKHGAWVSGNADEMGCVLAPIDPLDGLAGVAVEGRA